MQFNSKLLELKIKEKYGTQEKLATAMNMNRTTLNLKLTGKNDFSSSEMRKLISLLDIEPHKIWDYFFTQQV